MKPSVRLPLPSVPSPKKLVGKKKPMLPRTNSLSSQGGAKSVEVSPVFSTRAMGKSFSAEAMNVAKVRMSDPGVKLPVLYTELPHLAAYKLPKTEPPAAAKAYTIKKRFSDMEKTLERIPSEDFLGTLLYSRPDFRRVLDANLRRCQKKLAKLKLVQAAIREEDGDFSERALGLVEESG